MKKNISKEYQRKREEAEREIKKLRRKLYLINRLDFYRDRPETFEKEWCEREKEWYERMVCNNENIGIKRKYCRHTLSYTHKDIRHVSGYLSKTGDPLFQKIYDLALKPEYLMFNPVTIPEILLKTLMRKLTEEEYNTYLRAENL